MSYLFALALTLLIEGAVVFLFGFRSIRYQVSVALVNGITHPLFHLILLLSATPLLRTLSDIILVIGMLEGVIVMVEFFFLAWLYPKKKKIFLLFVSLCMNTASALAGFFIFF